MSGKYLSLVRGGAVCMNERILKLGVMLDVLTVIYVLLPLPEARWPLLENFQRLELFCFLQLQSSILTQLKLLKSSYEPVSSILESL